MATKPELAARMIGRFLEAGHRVGRAAADEVYGGNPKLRAALEERGVGYVLAVASPHEVATGAGKFRADAQAAKVPKQAWQKLSAGAGAKGHRFYNWAVLDLAEPRPGSHRPLIRRNRTSGELALPLLVASLGAPGHAGPRRRVEMAGGGDLPERKGPGGTGRAPGPPLHLLDPLGHPRHACPRLSRRRPRRRTRAQSRPGGVGPAFLQRDPAPVHHAHRPASPRRSPPTPLVRLATRPSSPVPYQPLPATSRVPDMKITIYGWSTRGILRAGGISHRHCRRFGWARTQIQAREVSPSNHARGRRGRGSCGVHGHTTDEPMAPGRMVWTWAHFRTRGRTTPWDGSGHCEVRCTEKFADFRKSGEVDPHTECCASKCPEPFRPDRIMPLTVACEPQ